MQYYIVYTIHHHNVTLQLGCAFGLPNITIGMHVDEYVRGYYVEQDWKTPHISPSLAIPSDLSYVTSFSTYPASTVQGSVWEDPVYWQLQLIVSSSFYSFSTPAAIKFHVHTW